MFELSSPLLFIDSYKGDHLSQYPKELSHLYSNFTPRKSRITGQNKMVVWGIQAWIKEMLLTAMQEHFFTLKKDKALAPFKRRMASFYNPKAKLIDAVADLYDLGYTPLRIKALPEGSYVNMGIPILTIASTVKEFAWLVNYWETCMSNMLWELCTSATTGVMFRQIFEKWGNDTGIDPSFIDFQGHDFAMRGMSGLWGTCGSAAGHLLSFSGTDTIGALDFIEAFYETDTVDTFIGGSIPATEHSVMCIGGPDGEFATIKRLISEVYPSGPMAFVADTYNLWRVLTEYLPMLKDIILARPANEQGLPGKVVIRPDSGDPADILCGDPNAAPGSPEALGVIELLYKYFPYKNTKAGFKQLDPHIGAIYGDSITFDRAEEIMRRLAKKGFASNFGPLGIGSFSYRYTTRDTFGLAMKATYCEVDGKPVNIFKDPITDKGSGGASKKSAKGLLCVTYDPVKNLYNLEQEVSKEREQEGLLQTVFEDDKLVRSTNFLQVRSRLRSQL